MQLLREWGLRVPFCLTDGLGALLVNSFLSFDERSDHWSLMGSFRPRAVTQSSTSNVEFRLVAVRNASLGACCFRHIAVTVL